MEWLEKVLWKWVEKKRKGAYTLLVVDGHDSHLSWDFIKFCKAHNIVLMCLPAHTTHILQPADVGLLGPLQHFYSTYVDRISRYNHMHIDKTCFLAGLVEARKKAYTTENVLLAFATAGLVPFNPEHAYKRLSPSEPKDVDGRPTTPESRTGAVDSHTPHGERQVNAVVDALLERNALSPKSIRLLTKLSKTAKGHAIDHVILQNNYESMLAANAYKKKKDRRLMTTEAQIVTKETAMGEFSNAHRAQAHMKRKARWLALRKERLRFLQTQGIDTERKRPRKGRLVVLQACLMPQADVETDSPSTDDGSTDSEDMGFGMDM